MEYLTLLSFHFLPYPVAAQSQRAPEDTGCSATASMRHQALSASPQAKLNAQPGVGGGVGTRGRVWYGGGFEFQPQHCLKKKRGKYRADGFSQNL